MNKLKFHASCLSQHGPGLKQQPHPSVLAMQVTTPSAQKCGQGKVPQEDAAFHASRVCLAHSDSDTFAAPGYLSYIYDPPAQLVCETDKLKEGGREGGGRREEGDQLASLFVSLALLPESLLGTFPPADATLEGVSGPGRAFRLQGSPDAPGNHDTRDPQPPHVETRAL